MSSKIPSDLLVPRGLNGLLDTYPDMNYGLGVLEKRFMQDGTGEDTALLPDGVMRAEEDGLGDLGEFMRESSQDLSFIDVEPDPVIQNLSEYAQPDLSLQATWGELETPAIYAEHQKDLTAIPRVVNPKELDEELLEDTVRKCARLFHAGATLEQVQKVAFDRLGSDATELVGDFEYLSDEVGLMGNVYVLASAYPNLYNKANDWKKHLKKTCPSAKYLLVEPNSKFASMDNFQGLKVVTEIPYKEALSEYAPLLNSMGKKLATGNPRKVLQQAFLSSSRKQVREAWFQSTTSVVDTISMKEAKEQFASHTPEERKVYSDDARQQKILLRKARLKLATAYRSGLMSRTTLKRIATLKDHNQIERELARLKMTSHRGVQEYSGERNSISRQQSLVRDTGDANARIKEAKHKEKVAKVTEKVEIIKKAISRGVRGEQLAKIIRIKLNKEDLKIASPLLNPILEKTNALALQQEDVAEYSGTKFAQHQEQRKVTHAKKLSREELATEKMSRWVRQQMSEGVVGKTLTTLLKSKFASPFLRSASGSIASLRDQHEGLSGHIYVDAEAYASPRGTTGCDEGGLKHRANQLKFVMAFDRCRSCKFASETASGDLVCQKYNKTLIDELPDGAKDYQKESIRLADASDAETTASLFAGSYDPNEFALDNSPLNYFSFDETASNETLSGVLFGGLEISDDD